MAGDTRTLVDETAATIRRRIVDGTFPVGGRLPPERELVAELDVSRAVLREALSRLEALGMLESRTTRGRWVAEGGSSDQGRVLVEAWLHQSASRVLEIDEVRAALEQRSIASMSPRDAVDASRRARVVLDEQRAAVQRGDAMEAAARDAEFHRVLCSYTRNAALRSFTEGLIDHSKDEPTALYSIEQEARASLDDHAEIVDALAAGDPAQAGVLVGEHLTAAARRFAAGPVVAEQEPARPAGGVDGAAARRRGRATVAPARIVVVGDERAAARWLPLLRDHPEAECAGVVLLEGGDLPEDCDGVVVASPPSLRARHATAALAAGAHVLVEPALAVSLAEARGLAAAGAASGRLVALAHGWNWSPIATWAADVVATGILGRLASVELFTATFAAEGRGEVVGELLGDGLAVACSLLANAPREVFARIGGDTAAGGAAAADGSGNSARDLADGPGAGRDIALSVAFDGGAIGSFASHDRMPWGTRRPLAIRLSGMYGGLTLDFERERADLQLEPARMAAEQRALKGLPHALQLRAGDGAPDDAGPLRLLIDACRGREAVNRAPVELGVRCAALAEAARASAASGAPAVVAPLG